MELCAKSIAEGEIIATRNTFHKVNKHTVVHIGQILRCTVARILELRSIRCILQTRPPRRGHRPPVGNHCFSSPEKTCVLLSFVPSVWNQRRCLSMFNNFDHPQAAKNGLRYFFYRAWMHMDLSLLHPTAILKDTMHKSRNYLFCNINPTEMPPVLEFCRGRRTPQKITYHCLWELSFCLLVAS